MAAKSGTESTKAAAAKVSPAAQETIAGGIETVEVTVESSSGKKATFTCPATAEDVPYRFFLNMEAEKPLHAFAAMLGDEGLAKMDKINATQREFNQFVEKWSEATGLGNDSD